MNTIDIKLYDIFRKDLNLPEGKAQELVQAIGEAIKDQSSGKHEHTTEIIHKDIQSLKEYIDSKFSSKEDVANTRTDMIKWMFIFWIGQIAATFGFILLFLKK